jgi:hypothetical protein
MQTKYKHKKLALILLFLSAFIFLRAGMIGAFFTRFFPDQRVMDFQAMNPGVPFPQDLQMQLAFFQSWWYVLGFGFLLALPIVYRISKRLLFTKPFKSTLIALVSLSILQMVTHFG